MAIDRLLSATEVVGLPLDNLLQKQVKGEAPAFRRLRPSVLAMLEHGIEGSNELSLDAEVQREAAIALRLGWRTGARSQLHFCGDVSGAHGNRV